MQPSDRYDASQKLREEVRASDGAGLLYDTAAEEVGDADRFGPFTLRQPIGVISHEPIIGPTDQLHHRGIPADEDEALARRRASSLRAA